MLSARRWKWIRVSKEEEEASRENGYLDRSLDPSLRFVFDYNPTVTSYLFFLFPLLGNVICAELCATGRNLIENG